MKILGEGLLVKDAEGRLLSRIGTLFFRTPGLVTKRGVHAMQRMMWIEDVNATRAAAGQPPLTSAEEEAEIEQSVDLIFTEDTVLIRPDPDRMDLALKADAELQKMVSKRQIRYLNTSSAKVRAALCARGENWRMARHPISPEDMGTLVEKARVSIAELPVYYYNKSTGTRYITAGGYRQVSALDAAAYRRQIVEVVNGLNKRNRLGQSEVDIFPPSTPIEIKNGFRNLAVDKLDDVALRATVEKLAISWRASLPSELREETVNNFEWRNTMCHVLTHQPNETNAEEQELISGIAPEFYRQIEWLPGACINNGELIFDELFDEAEHSRDPELQSLCDSRVKELILNLSRLFGAIDYINVGRIAHSLARKPVEGNRRGNVYIVLYHDSGAAAPKVLMIRFQKWGVAERLDEGKNLLQAILESDEYSDFILDRRLMCRQFGMNLPHSIGFGHLTERYRSAKNSYNGMIVRTAYFVRPYIRGIATDKIPPARFKNPAFALRFAELVGSAAAIDCCVGRESSVTHEMLFDRNYETIVLGADGLPSDLIVTDHAGSFVNYEKKLEDYVAAYADVVRRRRNFVSDYSAFARAYVKAFAAKFAEMQDSYRARRSAFDGLFRDRPIDTNGSGAYRWTCALERLNGADVPRLADILLARALAPED